MMPAPANTISAVVLPAMNIDAAREVWEAAHEERKEPI